VKGKAFSFNRDDKIITIDPTYPVTEQLRYIIDRASDIFHGPVVPHWYKGIPRISYVRASVNELLAAQASQNFNQYLIWKQTQGKVTTKFSPRRHGGAYDRIFDSWKKGSIHLGQAIQRMADELGSEPVGGNKALGNYYQALAKQYEKEWDEVI